VKVLYISNNYPPEIIGGAELIAHRHLKCLFDQGFNCEVFSGCFANNMPAFTIRSDEYQGIKVSRVSLGQEQCSWEYENFRNTKLNKMFGNFLLESSPDIVHFHNLPGLSVDFIEIANSIKIPTVLTVHDHWGFCHRQTLTKPNGKLCQDISKCSECQPYFLDNHHIQQNILVRNEYVKEKINLVDVIISPSEYLAKQYYLAGAASKGVEIISYGVNLANYYPLKRQTPIRKNLRFGIASYLGKHKGVDKVLDAISMLPEGLDVKFLIAGKGPLEKEIKEFIKNHHNGAYLEFVGWIPPEYTPRFLQTLDIFICASQWPENQPLSIMEAMACGLAVIATNIGGNPELVRHNISGQIIDVFNIHELTNSFLSYIKNPLQASTHGAAGARIISRDNMLQAVNRLKNVYLNLKFRR
jgi:glycosyltransferase involved in cell wall biosynthesis